MKARLVRLEHAKHYYNLHTGDNKLTVEQTDKDPFMATKLTAIANDDRNRILAPEGSIWRMVDKNGKVIQSSEQTATPGKMK